MNPPDTARDVVLARIREALGPDPHRPEIPRDHATTSDLDAPGILTRFAERVDDYHATVHHTDARRRAATLAGILTAAGSRRVGVPAGLDPGWLADLGPAVEVVRDGAPGDPHAAPAPETVRELALLDVATLDTLDVVVTAAAVGIAETGTIVLDASPDQGRRALSLVPDHHICIIAHDRIVHTVAEGMARLDPTRPLTMISGPSATSDIELDRVEGVHGPRTLDVVIVTPSGPTDGEGADPVG